MLAAQLPLVPMDKVGRVIEAYRPVYEEDGVEDINHNIVWAVRWLTRVVPLSFVYEVLVRAKRVVAPHS